LLLKFSRGQENHTVQQCFLMLHIVESQEKSNYRIMAAKGKITIDQGLCKSCELCITVCPDKAIRIAETFNQKGYHPAEFFRETCKGCSLCAVMCPEVAIEVYRG
jgi:2-oxoglutarate ferredoxin oxidoreductase subunit delta